MKSIIFIALAFILLIPITVFAQESLTIDEEISLIYEKLDDIISTKYSFNISYIYEGKSQFLHPSHPVNNIFEESWYEFDSIFRECLTKEDGKIRIQDIMCFHDSLISIEKNLHLVREELYDETILEFKTTVQNSDLSKDEQSKILYDFSIHTKNLPATLELNHKRHLEKLEKDRLEDFEKQQRIINEEKAALENKKRYLAHDKMEEKITEIKQERFAKELELNPDVLPEVDPYSDLDFYVDLFQNEEGFQEWYDENIPEYPNFCDFKYYSDDGLNQECNEKMSIINELFPNEIKESESTVIDPEPMTIRDPEPTKTVEQEKSEIKNKSKIGFFDSLIKMFESWFG